MRQLYMFLGTCQQTYIDWFLPLTAEPAQGEYLQLRGYYVEDPTPATSGVEPDIINEAPEVSSIETKVVEA
jgi:hypothetical protein